MMDLVKRLQSLELDISTERGPFVLFALFLREDSLDRWDLVVAAPWLSFDQRADLEFIAKRVQSGLPLEDLVRISRVVILPAQDPLVTSITSAVGVQHGSVTVSNSVFSGMHIKQAYFITSQQAPVPAAAPSN
jgi:hypothetical protein